MDTLSAAARSMANDAYIGEDVACLRLLPGSGPKDAYDALEVRTGTRAWQIVGLRSGYARFVTA